ncbi:hypothetical protein OG389_13625 [Streptomyces sp. NBC_00435]|uniref:hypothetical protein n=1 Tax=Streptomyces sp. NBC_00435 TaxID=2903649 RepID=UPI002E1D1FEF
MTEPTFETYAEVNQRVQVHEAFQASKDAALAMERMKPTYRPRFDMPEIPASYQPHSTDDKGVKDAGKALDNAVAYLSRNAEAHEAAATAFGEVVNERRTAIAEYESAVSEAVSKGMDAPEYPELDEKALTAAHRELNKLETVIPAAAGKADDAVSAFAAERSRLRATATYRKWADKEAATKNEAAVKALNALREALAERDTILGTLPDAFSDMNGVPFQELRSGNTFGSGGLAGSSAGPASLGDSLAFVEAAVTPGEGVSPWMPSQLPPEAREEYAGRVAHSKIDHNAARKAEQSDRLADALQHRMQRI